MTTTVIPRSGYAIRPQLPRQDFAPVPLTSRDLETIRAWDRARDLWLSSRASPNTRRAYQVAYDDFFTFTGRLPWEVSRSDVLQWVDDLRARHLSPETINLRLAALSSFYAFTMQTCSRISSNGQEIPLQAFNPVGAVPRPKRSPYNKSRYLTLDEARALLRAIPRYTPQGSRDYALFLCYLATGRRNSEIRNLRWGDFNVETQHAESPKIYYRWHGKRTHRRDELPARVWIAILEFLKITSREDSIHPEDYLFTALTDIATRLPNVDTATWDPNRLLSARQVGRLLKKYVRRAGLDPTKITVHTLRHTAAMLRKQAGDDVEKISAFLAHSSLAVTQIYLHQVEGQTDTSWAKVEVLLGLT